MIASTANTLSRGLLQYFTRDNPDLLNALAIGGIVGALCFVPSYLFIHKKNLPDKIVNRLLWINMIAGAIAGFCLAIPVGIGTFLYVAALVKNNDKP